jgi:catechol 2,3-dioxygenase-like lactoylglutathione lyase family enzyme
MSETTEIRNLVAKAGTRYLRDDNPFGFKGLDHFAMPSLDIDLMVRFMTEVLGGELFYAAGYDETDRELGRSRHVFVRVGATLMQVATPRDGRLRIGREDPNGWPHWAFDMTAADLDANVERLRGLGIPVYGPVAHRGYEGNVSAYFASPEGHKFELTTYDDYPEERMLGYTGTPGVGHPNWPQLFHDWPNVG